MNIFKSSAIFTSSHLSRWVRAHRIANWAFLDQAVVSGSNFLTGILLARYLGLGEFGRFSLAWIVVLFFSGLQTAMIISPMMSLGPMQETDQLPSYYGAVFMQQLIWAGSSFVVIFLGVWGSQFLFPIWKANDIALPLASALLAYLLQDFIRRYFFVKDLAHLALINDSISYIGQLCFLITFAQFATLKAGEALWIIAGTSGIAVAVGLFTVSPLYLSRNYFIKVFSRHWNLSKWLICSSLMQFASSQFFFLIAGYKLGAASVGAMKAAQNVIGILHIVFQSFENFVPSQASREYLSGKREALSRYLTKIVKFGCSVTVIIAGLCFFFAEFWMNLIYGNEYSGYGYILQWLSITYIIIFFAFPITAGLRTIERTKGIFVAFSYSSIFSVIFSCTLVSHIELKTILFGLLISKIIVSYFLFIEYKKKVN